jgi:acetyltransferase-like isoleucine patch superfamily enzyme
MILLQSLIISQDSVNDEKVLIISTFFKDGEKVSKGDVVLEFETSKAIVTIEAEQQGFIFYDCKEGDTVPIGAHIGEINSEKRRNELAQKVAVVDSLTENRPKEKIIQTLFSNKAKLLLIKNGIDEFVFNGQDLINEEDVILYAKKTQEELSKSPTKNVSVTSKESQNTLLNNLRERIIIVCPSIVGMEVILDIIDGQDNLNIVGYVTDDDFKEKISLPFLDCNVFNFTEKINPTDYDGVVIALGGSLKSMQFRKKIFEYYSSRGIKFSNLISNKANICKNVKIGCGNIIGSGVFIGAGSQIGDNNFISYMTVIGHHNRIGANNLFAPGVMMSGLVEIGDDCILTTGVNFIDKVKVGSRVILPLGYNVVTNLADDTIIKIKQ